MAVEEAPVEEPEKTEVLDEEAAEAEVPAEEEDEEDEDDTGVQEHLKDAVEGNLRLKRYLTQDDDGGPAAKQRKKEGPQELKVKQLLTKWRLMQDLVAKHILDQVDVDDLDLIIKTGWAPQGDLHKSACERLARYVNEMRERRLPGGGNLDTVASFRARWKLPADSDKKLRALVHQELRHIVMNFDGTGSIDDAIKEAKTSTPEGITTSAIPDEAGTFAISRFNRLELIDPLADAAVFGDANLTFSVRLAKHRKVLGHVGRVIATTFEDLDTLRERYKEINDSIKDLEEHHAEVYHEVDCTRIALNPKFEGLEGTLGAVYYNFPHSGAVGGFFDSHPIVNWRHENLMRLFFRALRSFVKPGGSVKVSSNMGAVGVRYSYIIGSGIENEFVHTETMPFMEWHLHRYGRSYGDKRDQYKRPDAQKNESYNAQRAEADMVYCFRYEPKGDTLPPQTIRLPPNRKTLMSCTDGPFRDVGGQARSQLAERLHKRFVTEVSGTHVG